MKIGVTGTPGTGKSTISKQLDGRVVDLKEYLEEKDLGEVNEDGEIEVEIEELRENTPEEPADRDLILEGHLAHFLDLDYCVVLRCRPDVLRERLEKRDYSSEKVEENIESEKMDLILSQAVRNQEKVFEVDTTGKDVEEVVDEVRKGIENREESYGVVDWSEFI
ncbi:MAG: adenylate kinase family protein [Candidatus Nanosalina sp.]